MKKLMGIFLFFIFSSLHGQQIRGFSLPNLQNQTLSFEEIKGEKLTVFDFWTTWCKPCLKSIPEINKLHTEFQEKGVSFAGVNCDGPRSMAKVSPMAKTLGIIYPVLLDPNMELMKELNLNSFPSLVIVNSKGKVVWFHEGFNDGDQEELRNQLIRQLSLTSP